MSDTRRSRYAWQCAMVLVVAALAASAWISYNNIESLNDLAPRPKDHRAALATALAVPLVGVTLFAATIFAMRRYSRERRLVETDLRDSRARYHALVEHLPYAVLVEHLGEVVFANTAV